MGGHSSRPLAFGGVSPLHFSTRGTYETWAGYPTSLPEEISMHFAVIVGVASRSILLYVRTRGAYGTGERREINPAGPPRPILPLSP